MSDAAARRLLAFAPRFVEAHRPWANEDRPVVVEDRPVQQVHACEPKGAPLLRENLRVLPS